MYFQRKSKVKPNRPSVCNYHHGSHATAPQIRFTPRNHILNLLALGMENLLCNGKGAPYFGRVEFEGGLWRSALSLRAREGRLQNLPAHRPCSLKTPAGLAAPNSRAVFWRVNSRIQPWRPFVGWV